MNGNSVSIAPMSSKGITNFFFALRWIAARARVSPAAEYFGYAQITKDLEASGVDDQRPRLVRTVDQAVDDSRPHSEGVQGSGEHQACWTRAHHQNVD